MLEVNALSKSYGAKIVLSDINFYLRQGESLVLSGDKCSGKSVLLKLIAGHESCSVGRILIDKKPVKSQQVNLIFANHYLHPESTVYENLAYRLYIKGLRRSEIRQRIDRAADLLNLSSLLISYPNDLNIFSYIRVVFARALVQQASLYLLDAPWCGFPLAVQKRLVRLLSALQKKQKFAVIYASRLNLYDSPFKDYKITQQFELKSARLSKKSD
ncbi:ATP-binding cassette domain-containing protein [Piscirickettsia litoralis]|uniref:ABC transporter family protein n=1 Tax=Piscirickettsia litoralis TaxID=1891921 RepID=A0ABX3A4T1_9GAMM|nr:ATP-binding cassette domain-containing protein [Piscirickettsia litoralis]ODN42410.1 ABC transporter family protein [Piscirickettsia litoralis]